MSYRRNRSLSNSRTRNDRNDRHRSKSNNRIAKDRHRSVSERREILEKQPVTTWITVKDADDQLAAPKPHLINQKFINGDVDRLKNDLQDRLKPDKPIRGIFTPAGGTEVKDIAQIQPHQNYVISAFKYKPKKDGKKSKRSSENNSRQQSDTGQQGGRLTLMQRQDLIAKQAAEQRSRSPSRARKDSPKSKRGGKNRASTPPPKYGRKKADTPPNRGRKNTPPKRNNTFEKTKKEVTSYNSKYKNVARKPLYQPKQREKTPPKTTQARAAWNTTKTPPKKTVTRQTFALNKKGTERFTKAKNSRTRSESPKGRKKSDSPKGRNKGQRGRSNSPKETSKLDPNQLKRGPSRFSRKASRSRSTSRVRSPQGRSRSNSPVSDKSRSPLRRSDSRNSSRNSRNDSRNSGYSDRYDSADSRRSDYSDSQGSYYSDDDRGSNYSYDSRGRSLGGSIVSRSRGGSRDGSRAGSRNPSTSRGPSRFSRRKSNVSEYDASRRNSRDDRSPSATSRNHLVPGGRRSKRNSVGSYGSRRSSVGSYRSDEIIDEDNSDDERRSRNSFRRDSTNTYRSHRVNIRSSGFGNDNDESPGRLLTGRQDSVFRPSTNESRGSARTIEVDYDTDESGLFKAKSGSREAADARSILDTSKTKIDMPVDAKEAETVKDEVTRSFRRMKLDT